MPGVERGAECRIGRCREAGTVIERAETGATPIVDQARGLADREAGEFGQRLFEQPDIAGEQRPQHEAGGELAGLAQVPHKWRDSLPAAGGGDGDGRLVGGLADDALGPILGQPGAIGDEGGERGGELHHQGLAGAGREVIAREERLADIRILAEALDDPVDGEGGNIDRVEGDDGKAGLDAANLGNGGGHRRRHMVTAGDGILDERRARADEIDQFRIEQQRRLARHDGGDLRLVLQKADDDRVRRVLERRQRVSEGPPHQRRGIVEKRDHRGFRRSPVVGGEVGMEIGARESRGRIGPVAGRCRLNPPEEVTYDHRDCLNRGKGLERNANSPNMRRA